MERLEKSRQIWAHEIDSDDLIGQQSRKWYADIMHQSGALKAELASQHALASGGG